MPMRRAQFFSVMQNDIRSWRRGAESNRREKVLLTLALPLGDRAPDKSSAAKGMRGEAYA